MAKSIIIERAKLRAEELKGESRKLKVESLKLKDESKKCRGEELINQFATPFGIEQQILYLQASIKKIEADLKTESDKTQVAWMRKMIMMDRSMLENLYTVQLFGIRLAERLDLEDFARIEKEHG